MKMYILVALCLTFAPPTNASLINRGGGLIYDTDLDITWLADANYAMTSGYDADGMMSWSESLTWANQLQFAGHDNWRLPTALNQDGSSPCSSGECNDSEMGHIYFIELNGLRGIGTLPTNDPDYALFNNTIQEGLYWTSTIFTDDPSFTNYAWQFQFDRGRQGAHPMSELFHAWAVHDGDIGAPVPLPATVWLFVSGVIFLVKIGRWRAV